jgi:hypothetical protein
MSERYLADVDSDFVALRPELRDWIREAEKAGREAMEESFKSIGGHIGALLVPLAEELTQNFLKTQLHFYRMLDIIWPLAEQAQREREKRPDGPVM